MERPLVTADLAADLLLRFYREPLRYQVWMLEADRVLGCPVLILRLALGQSIELSDPALDGPGVVAELERAAIFFVRQVFFRDEATHYQVLGLTPDADSEAIHESFRLLMQLTHPDRREPDSAWPEAFAARVTRAYTTLRNPESRAAYDRQLATKVEPKTDSPVTTHAAKLRARRSYRQIRLPILPEWMTAGVGGFMWRHPTLIAIVGMTAVAIFIVGLVAWSEADGKLTRIAPQPLRALQPGSTSAVSDAIEGLPSSLQQITLRPPTDGEVEAVVATFLSSYEAGRLDTFAALFDDDAEFNLNRGRASIRHEYDELFRRSAWRRMNVSQLRWTAVGDRVEATGQIKVRIEYRDGSEVQQRLTLDMMFVRRGERTVITRLSQRPLD
jgi:hypothetical protein